MINIKADLFCNRARILVHFDLNQGYPSNIKVY